MALVENLANLLRQRPKDVVGIDIAASGVKAVRMVRGGAGKPQVVAMDVLPAILLPDMEEPTRPFNPLRLPHALKSRYASLTVSGHDSVVKLLSFPGALDGNASGKVVAAMGLKQPDDYRLSYRVTTEGHGRTESRVLSVAIPEVQARAAVGLLPTGLPVPFSLEVSGLAMLTAFMRGPGAAHAAQAAGVLEFGDVTSSLALFSRGQLALIRRFDLGTEQLLDRLESSLGVDRATATGIIADGSFDIEQPVSESLAGIMKHLVVSRDFVERRENCRLETLYVSGGIALSASARDHIAASMDLDVKLWSPLENLDTARDALPSHHAGREWRFAAAIGACLATLEDAT
jgi:Tfp pilus assembly PilM family ATPase